MSRGNGGGYDNQNTIFSREARPSRVGERGSEEITEGEKDLPRDAKIMKILLKSMEFTRSMQVRLLCDGGTLAIQSKVNFSFSRPSPREVLLELARNGNKIPLPRSIGGPGITLPPNQDTLLGPNYQLAIPKNQPVETIE